MPCLARFRIPMYGLILQIALAGVSALALDPDSPMTGFLRTDFTVESGLPSNVVNAIAQTEDGLLWIGTDSGLARFNGRRFLSVHFRAPQPAPQGIVRALAVGEDGDLWIATNAGLARITKSNLGMVDHSLATFYHLGEGVDDEVTCLHVAVDGTLWIGSHSGLYRWKNGAPSRVLSDIIYRIEDGARGHLFVISSRGLLEWNGTGGVEHPSVARPLDKKRIGFFDVMQDRRDTTWFSTGAGLARFANRTLYRFPGYGRHGNSLRVFEDGQGTIWTWSIAGFYRVSGNKLEALKMPTAVREVYSDQSGDLWIGTNGGGLLRLKDQSVRMFTKADGLPSITPMAVLIGHDGNVWVGNNCGGLSVMKHGRFRNYGEKYGLSNSCVWALAEDHKRNIWVGTWGGGLYCFTGEHFSQFSQREGLPGDVVRSIQVAPDDSLWLAVFGGVSHMKNGHFRNYTTADGLSSDRVISVYQDRTGGIWAGTIRGIDHLVGDRFQPVETSTKIFDPRYMSFGQDRSGVLYAMDAPKGLARFTGNQFVNLIEDLDLLSMKPAGRDIWFSGGDGLFRFSVPDIPVRKREIVLPLNYASFGMADGMATTQCSSGSPNMALSSDGKLWVATVKGLAELELDKLPRSNAKPSIFISEVTVGRNRRVAGRELILDPEISHTEIHFDSISLRSPEKIRFQYRMDGIDGAWLDADRSLAAIYTKLPAGTHDFHVRACNSEGVWDPIGITYPVIQQPYFYETQWFRLGALALFGLILTIAYRLRLKQIASQYNIRLDERVNERTRIARELHDTLLQSFHGLMLRFQAVQNLLPERPDEAKQSLEIAIDRAADAITESRNAVQELRIGSVGASNLVPTLTSLGEDFAVEHAASQNGQPTTRFRVLVEGAPRQLHAPIQNDLYCISREAIGNAFRHAHAKQIELDIRYGTRMLRLRVRDDGIGMSSDLLARGARKGHWGLPGMRERAKAIGARLDVWSNRDRGTEIELAVPARIAYGDQRQRNFHSEK